MVFQVTKNGTRVGLVRFTGRESYAKRLERLDAREAARVTVWVSGFLPTAGLFDRVYYDDGVAEWGLEQVTFTEWVESPLVIARRPGKVVKRKAKAEPVFMLTPDEVPETPREEPKSEVRPERHNPDLDAMMAEPVATVKAKEELRPNADLDAIFGV